MIVNFRKLQIEDYEIYRSLRLDCLENFPENFGSSRDEEAKVLAAKFKKFASNPASDFLLGAFDKQNLIGIAGFERAERRKTQHRGEIVQIYVSPNYAGQGIGSSLLQKVIEAAFEIEGVEQIELGVVSNNLQAIRLYEKFGFKIYGVQPNYFKDEGKYWHQKLMQLCKDEYKTKLQEM